MLNRLLVRLESPLSFDKVDGDPNRHVAGHEVCFLGTRTFGAVWFSQGLRGEARQSWGQLLVSLQ